MEDSVLYDLPGEFLAHMAASARGGTCDAQSILPRGGRYACHCTCGRWDVEVSTSDEGVRLARQHTSESDG
jgi:hypothetical protein